MLSHSKFTLAIAPYHTVNTESSSVPAWQWQSVHIADRRASCCQLRTLNLSSSRLWSNRWVCLTSVRLCARSHLKFTSTVFQDSTTAPAWPAWTSPPSKVQLCTHCFCTLAHVHVSTCAREMLLAFHAALFGNTPWPCAILKLTTVLDSPQRYALTLQPSLCSFLCHHEGKLAWPPWTSSPTWLQRTTPNSGCTRMRERFADTQQLFHARCAHMS